MAAAALTPRVRLMVVCGAGESTTEPGVYHLRGVRQGIAAPVFPFVAFRLWLFLVLSSPRSGSCPGYVRVLDDGTDRAILFAHLAPDPSFEEHEQTLAAVARLRCTFPHAGPYTIQVWFYREQESDVLKGELPFVVTLEGE